MEDKSPFLSPRLVGARFDDHSIPVDLLRDFAYLEQLLIETAKWRYREAHPSRKRTPKGFTDGVPLRLSGIGSGSAVATLNLAVGPSDDLISEVEVCFEEARDSILKAISAASNNTPPTGHLPTELLTYFDKFGRSLEDSEYIEFGSGAATGTVRLSQASRKRLVLASGKVREITEEERLRGWIFAVDKKRQEFQLQILGGPKVKGSLDTRHAQTILEAFNTYEKNSKVLVTAITICDQSGRIKAIDEIEHISILDPNDVLFRIEELKTLKDGWLDGKGQAPKDEQLDWFAQNFEAHYPADLPYPFIYPTPEGGLQVEWSGTNIELSLDADLAQQIGSWHALNMGSDEEEHGDVELCSADGWRSLFSIVLKFLEPES